MEQKVQRQLYRLNCLYKQSDEIYRGIAARFGLTETAFWILYAIIHSEGLCTQNDLCGEWAYPAQTIHSAVRSLQAKGLVTLEAIPGTKNRKKILLTKEGERFAERVVSRIDEIEANAFLSFTEEERETYLALYQRHLDNIRSERDKAFRSV